MQWSDAFIVTHPSVAIRCLSTPLSRVCMTITSVSALAFCMHCTDTGAQGCALLHFGGMATSARHRQRWRRISRSALCIDQFLQQCQKLFLLVRIQGIQDEVLNQGDLRFHLQGGALTLRR